MKFNVRFCRNNWVNTLNPDDVTVVTVEANSFDEARKKARKKVNEVGYTYKNGWKWNNTRAIFDEV